MLQFGSLGGFLGFVEVHLEGGPCVGVGILSCHFLMFLENIFSLVIATRQISVSCADMAGDTDVSTMEAYSLIACKRMLRDFLWS